MPSFPCHLQVRDVTIGDTVLMFSGQHKVDPSKMARHVSPLFRKAIKCHHFRGISGEWRHFWVSEVLLVTLFFRVQGNDSTLTKMARDVSALFGKPIQCHRLRVNSGCVTSLAIVLFWNQSIYLTLSLCTCFAYLVNVYLVRYLVHVCLVR